MNSFPILLLERYPDYAILPFFQLSSFIVAIPAVANRERGSYQRPTQRTDASSSKAQSEQTKGREPEEAGYRNGWPIDYQHDDPKRFEDVWSTAGLNNQRQSQGGWPQSNHSGQQRSQEGRKHDASPSDDRNSGANKKPRLESRIDSRSVLFSFTRRFRDSCISDLLLYPLNL